MRSMYSHASRSTSSVSDSTRYEPASGSAVSVTPVSKPMICWVRSASRAASSVGSDSASSYPLVCSDCVPPSTAASAWSATRTTLLTGCCAVSVEPPVCVWKRSIVDFGFVAPKRSVMIVCHIRRLARNLATSSKKSLWPFQKKRQPRRELVDVEARIDRSLHVRDRVRQRERDLLRRRRTRLADVVARDRDRVPARHVLRAVREDVGDDAHRLARRIHVRAAGDVLLEQVVLDRARDLLGGHALLLGDELVHQQQDRRRRVDRHRRGDLIERKTLQERPHVVERVDRHTDLADLALGAGVIGVVAHLRRQVERTRQAGLAGVQQEVEPLVGGRRVAETRVLAHRPVTAPVHRRVDPAGERGLSRQAELLGGIPVGEIVLGVQRFDLDPGVGSACIIGHPSSVDGPVR